MSQDMDLEISEEYEADKNKIVKGLQCHHIDELRRINCAECPYYSENDSRMDCLNKLLDDALFMIKQQHVIIKSQQNIIIYIKNQEKTND